MEEAILLDEKNVFGNYSNQKNLEGMILIQCIEQKLWKY
jgi:hypothetical protein